MPHVAVRPHVPAHIGSSACLLLSVLQPQLTGVCTADPFTPLAVAASRICNSRLLIMNAGLSGPSEEAPGGCKGRPNAAGATTGPLPPGEVHIPQRCKHLRVRMLSPIPIFTKISRNFYFQEMYPPGIPGGLHFHHTSNYWKICWDQNGGEWRDQTLGDSCGKDPEPFSWICFSV